MTDTNPVPVIRKPTVLDAGPLVKAIYQRSCVGCCLHIVLDDDNVRDDDVQFCINYAHDQHHADCEQLARMLLLMSRTQRLKLGNDRRLRGGCLCGQLRSGETCPVHTESRRA